MGIEVKEFEEGILDSRFTIRSMVQKGKQRQGRDMKEVEEGILDSSLPIRSMVRKMKQSKGT